MTITELGALGEFVGAIAVVATLIYLALQVRQHTFTTKAQMVQDAAAAQQRVLMRLMDDDMVQATIRRQNGEPRTDADVAKRRTWFTANLRGHESYYYQYQQGLFDEGIHHAKTNALRGMARDEAFRAVWSESRGNWSPDFADYIDGLMGEVQIGTQ